MKKLASLLFALAMVVAACGIAAAGEKPVVTLDEITKDGYIGRWLVIGRFSPGIAGGYTGMVVSRKANLTEADYLADKGGETGVMPEDGLEHKRGESTTAWKSFETKTPLLELGDVFAKSSECVMYAATYIQSDKPASLFMNVRSLTGTAVFVNHKLVRRSPTGSLGDVGDEKVQVPLEKGENLLIIKFGGLRVEKAATLLKQPLEEVRSFVRQFNPSLAESSGLALFVTASPLSRVGDTPVYIQTSLTPSGFFQGTGKNPKLEFSFTATNNSDKPVKDVTIRIASQKNEAVEKLSIDPKGFNSAYIALPVKHEMAGLSYPAVIEATFGGEKTTVQTIMYVPAYIPKRDEAIFYVPGFHADPVWIEDQRDYSVALIGSSRQNMLLCAADPTYGVFMSEIDYLKPFFDIYPEYRDPIRQYIKEGRVGTGGSYSQPVEKLISGEALIRNLLVGKLFHRKVLGASPRTYMGWDIFGHVPQLSQILAKSDNDGAMWSKGIWGFTPIFLHMSLDGTTLPHKRGEYGHWSRGLDTLRPVLYDGHVELKSYGLDNDIRLDCSDFKPPTPWIPGNTAYLRQLLPSIEVGGTGGDKFFASVKKQIDAGEAKIPTTSRDMGYYHQGTALTRESLKTGNRLGENALITAEKYATIAALFGAKYPDKAIDKGWRQLLFGQHHDALTGTINDKSYLDLMQGYRETLDLATEVIEKSLAHIGEEITSLPPAGASEASVPLAVFNPLNWDRTDAVRTTLDFSKQPVKGFYLTDSGGSPVQFETDSIEKDDSGNISKAKIVFIAEKVPQMGYSVFFAQPTDKMPDSAIRDKGDASTISNDYYKLTIDPKRGGGIVSLVDKETGKEIINEKAGVGNDIAAIAEDPSRHEPPWEMFTLAMRSFSSEQPAKITSETGPVTQRLKIEGVVGKTNKVQEITLYKNMRRIDMAANIVDYKGLNEMFVVTFPVSVENAVPVFEDRYGVIVRKKSKEKLNFQTWQMNNYSDHFAHAAYQWLDQSHSGLIEFRDGGSTTASFALGMMTMVMDHGDAARKAQERLTQAFVKKGITSTPWYDDNDKVRREKLPRSDSTYPADMNFDLAFGTSFRVSLNSGMNNLFTIKVFSMLDKDLVAKFEQKVRNDGHASMLVYDPTSDDKWPAVPLLIIKGVNDDELLKAAEAIAADFDADGVISLGADANATGGNPMVEDYGVAVLNQGTVLNSVENDGTMAMALMHTASFFRRLPFELVPENRTAAFPYALFPHQGNWSKAGLHRAGFEYNNPLIAEQLTQHLGTLPTAGTSFMTVQPDNLIVTAIKPRGNPVPSMSFANSDPAQSIAFRMYEATGNTANAKITFFTGIKKAVWTDMLEEKDFGRVNVTTGTLETAVSPFSIVTLAFAPQNVPTRKRFALLGAENEVYDTVYSRYWMHNNGAAPLGFMPVTIGVRGNIQTDIHIEQGGVTINELEVFITNDYTDRKIAGTVKIETPFDWKALPSSFDYEIKPGSQFSKKIALAFLGEGRDGIVKVSTEIDGRTIQDVIEVGKHELEVKSERKGDTIIVKVKNPNNQSIQGELNLVTPQESWGTAATGDFALQSVTPRLFGFSLEGRSEQTFEFKISDARKDFAVSEWAVVKCAYNGKLIYQRVE